MGYWKAIVLPKLKKVFDNSGKKAAAAEACKSFDDSKEEINKEFEAKKIDLQPQVLQVYEASSQEIKVLIKEPKEAGLKKHSTSVTKFLEELAKIEFPGSKMVSEASSKLGPAYVSGPVLFVFEKVSTFIVVEEKKEEEATATASREITTVEENVIIVEDKEEEETVVTAQVAGTVAEKKPEEAVEALKA